MSVPPKQYSALTTLKDLTELAADLKFPSKLDERMQWLMDRNNDGLLTPSERDELAELADFSTTLSLNRAYSLLLLGRSLK